MCVKINYNVNLKMRKWLELFWFYWFSIDQNILPPYWPHWAVVTTSLWSETLLVWWWSPWLIMKVIVSGDQWETTPCLHTSTWPSGQLWLYMIGLQPTEIVKTNDYIHSIFGGPNKYLLWRWRGQCVFSFLKTKHQRILF